MRSHRTGTGILARPGRRRTRLMEMAALALAAVFLPLGSGSSQEAGQAPPIRGATAQLGSEEASLQLRMADGRSHTVALADGELRIDGESRGSYEPGGPLDDAWRQFLRGLSSFRPADVTAAIRGWNPDLASSGDAEAARRLVDVLHGYVTPPPATSAESGSTTVARPGGGQLTIAPGGLSLEDLQSRLRELGRSLRTLGKQSAEETRHLAMVVHDDYAIPHGITVPGNLALLDGDLRLGGTVEGDVLVLDGTLELEPTAQVDGSVLQTGGNVEENGGSVKGEIVRVTAPEPPAAEAPAAVPAVPSVPEVPEVHVHVGRERGFFGSIWHNFLRAFDDLLGTLSWFVVLGLIGAVVVYFARPQLEIVADAIRQDFGRAVGVGFASQLLFFPVLLVLVVAILTWLVIPFFLLAMALGLGMGYLASAHAAGEIVANQRYSMLERVRRSNSYYYVFSGLGLLLGLFAVAAVFELFGGMLGVLRGLTLAAAVVLSWAATTAGFGAVILTRAGTRPVMPGEGGIMEGITRGYGGGRRGGDPEARHG